MYKKNRLDKFMDSNELGNKSWLLTQPMKFDDDDDDDGYLAYSFLCTFVPGSEKSIERTFAPVELSFRGTFVPGEREVQELSFHETFAPLKLSLLMSECSKNFRSMELLHPWNLRSTNNFCAL